MATNLTTINGVPLPPGTYFFSRITDTDHAGYIWIVALLSLLYPLGSLFIRLNVRAGLHGADDFTLLAATLLSLFQHVPVFVGLRRGLGKATSVINEEKISGIDAALYGAEILFVVSYAATKISLALFVRRLFTNGRRINVILCWSLLGITAAWGVVALFTLLVDCSPHHFLSASEEKSCPALVLRWRTVTALDVLSEVAILAVPSYLVSSVMLASRPKLLVIIAFALRLPVIVFSVFHLYHLAHSVNTTNVKFPFTTATIWIQTWLCWAVVSASIPAFRAFMKPFDEITVARTDGSQSDPTLNGAYLMMGPVTKSGHRKYLVSAKSGGVSTGSVRLDKSGSRASVHDDSRHVRITADNRSVDSWGSQRGIIRREIEWEVRHEDKPL